MNRAHELPPLHLLVLVRLLPALDKGEARKKLGDDLKPLVEHRWSGQEWVDRLDRAIGELESTGAIGRVEDKKGKPTARLKLTDEGRRLALEALGIEALPPKTTWAKIRSLYLPALALGRPGPTGLDAKYLGGAPGLKAELLRGHYGLTIEGDRPKLKDVADSTAAKLMGLDLDEKFTTDNILRKLLRDAGIEIPAGQKPSPTSIGEALFRRELGDPAAKKPLDLIATRSVGARQDKAAELAAAILRSWVDRLEPTLPPGELDLSEFSRRVLDAARSSPGGWFGEAKVFIARVWGALADDPAFRGMDAESFKARLIEAHRARLLELGRADLVEAMDPVDVRESATPYLNAVYHFVRTEDQDR